MHIRDFQSESAHRYPRRECDSCYGDGIATGKGYVHLERTQDSETPIAVIPVDSIYTPVKKVNFTKENTRVGQVTDYDRLILEIWTDGSITPEEGVSIGAKIIQEHLDLFIGLGAEVSDLKFMTEKDEGPQGKSTRHGDRELELSSKYLQLP